MRSAGYKDICRLFIFKYVGWHNVGVTSSFVRGEQARCIESRMFYKKMEMEESIPYLVKNGLVLVTLIKTI